MIKLFNNDCLDLMKSNEFKDIVSNNKICIVTDPPFNVGYKYNSYKDKLKEEEYLNFLNKIFTMYNLPFVVIHYPEALYKIAAAGGVIPTRVICWVYNSNTARQHRDIAFFNVKPDLSKVTQPYKNLNDKRIQERIKNGKVGCKIYDWWEINQVKNVSKNKSDISHPCVMPIEVMNRIIGILPEEYTIFDPFMGSGTTGLACKNYNRNFIGCEIDETYFNLCKKRINENIKG